MLDNSRHIRHCRRCGCRRMRWPTYFLHLINQCMRNELDTLSAHFLHKNMICFGGAGVGIMRRIPFVYHACVFGVSESRC